VKENEFARTPTLAPDCLKAKRIADPDEKLDVEKVLTRGEQSELAALGHRA
jgi:hypothetical protein